MADDHSTGAISAYGSQLIQTPNLDRIADEGARLDATFCTNALCAPSRAAILTGTYNHTNRVRTLWEMLDNSRETFITDLKKVGYQSAMYGKWHLGHGPEHDPAGFDDWETLDGQGIYNNPIFFNKDGAITHEGYVTTVITDLALNFIEKRDKDRPFCVLVHHKAPHLPWTPDEKHKDLFKDVKVPEPVTLHEDLSTRPLGVQKARMRIYRDMKDFRNASGWGKEPEGLTPEELQSWAYQLYIKEYLRCIYSIDENVGRILDYLDENGLADDTIIVYTSDQGFFLGEHTWYDKRYMYEESLRMPMLMRYPREIAPGTIMEDIVTNVDFAATFCDYAGATPHPLNQGRSFREVVRGNVPLDWPKAMYYRYWEHDDPFHSACAHYGIRTERYKLICYYADSLGLKYSGSDEYPMEWEMFDLESDPTEMNNLFGKPEYKDLQERLTQELYELQSSVGDEKYFKGQKIPEGKAESVPMLDKFMIDGKFNFTAAMKQDDTDSMGLTK